MRLRGRAGVPYKGRVEVNIGGIWGTVTDHGWDIYDANVVCKQLHFGGAVGAYTGSSYGVGKGPVWMSDFECKGNEDSLAKCNHSNTEVQKRWAHYMDASVECFGAFRVFCFFSAVYLFLIYNIITFAGVSLSLNSRGDKSLSGHLSSAAS